MSDIHNPFWWTAPPSELYLEDIDGKPTIRQHFLPYSDDRSPAIVHARKGQAPEDHCPVCWITDDWRSLKTKCAHSNEPHFLVRRKSDRVPWGWGKYYGCLKALKDQSHEGLCWIERIWQVSGMWVPIATELNFDTPADWKRYQAKEMIVPADILQMAGKVAA